MKRIAVEKKKTEPDWKNKKSAIIAVCNKLLKQVFGCIKNGTLYDDNYGKRFV